MYSLQRNVVWARQSAERRRFLGGWTTEAGKRFEATKMKLTQKKKDVK